MFNSYESLHKDLIELIKLKSDPIGIKLFEEVRSDLPYINKNLALCQIMKLASIYGKTVGISAENVDACVIGTYILGFKELPDNYYRKWVTLRKMPEEIAKSVIANIHTLPMGKYKSGVLAPLKKFDELHLNPDGIIMMANSAQAYLLLVGYFDSQGIKPKSDFNGHAACEIVATVINGRSPWLTIPCGGARGLAEAQDDELWVGMRVEDLRAAMGRLKSVGSKYPPPVYQILMMEPIPEHSLTLLVGRT
ncbi:MAG: DUF169 domain-containing protein [Sulfolobales archaeon]|nr:DUF169 domain-containing protein [Sulfolobales archaeon]MCX8186012.1 DUF169 domain-containing protein [Sulfolobales archaeon]MDW7969269.1 DUF169 domain-containing protein [Sulfolobales archaeon]